VKVGRLVKFDVALLDTWIKQNTVMPMPQRGPGRTEQGKAVVWGVFRLVP